MHSKSHLKFFTSNNVHAFYIYKRFLFVFRAIQGKISNPFLSPDPLNPSMFLTVWAIYAASAADNGADKHCTAISAKFAGMTVYLQERSIAIVLSFGLQIIFWCNAIFINKIGQTFGNFRSKALPFL